VGKQKAKVIRPTQRCVALKLGATDAEMCCFEAGGDEIGLKDVVLMVITNS
jgi:hypothetical protein